VTALDRAVLRAEVGDQNYARLESICARLSELESRQIISPEGARAISLALADELAAQAIAREMARESIADRGRP
jgi:hypothetical protein